MAERLPWWYQQTNVEHYIDETLKKTNSKRALPFAKCDYFTPNADIRNHIDGRALGYERIAQHGTCVLTYRRVFKPRDVEIMREINKEWSEPTSSSSFRDRLRLARSFCPPRPTSDSYDFSPFYKKWRKEKISFGKKVSYFQDEIDDYLSRLIAKDEANRKGPIRPYALMNGIESPELFFDDIEEAGYDIFQPGLSDRIFGCGVADERLILEDSKVPRARIELLLSEGVEQDNLWFYDQKVTLIAFSQRQDFFQIFNQKDKSKFTTKICHQIDHKFRELSENSKNHQLSPYYDMNKLLTIFLLNYQGREEVLEKYLSMSLGSILLH